MKDKFIDSPFNEVIECNAVALLKMHKILKHVGITGLKNVIYWH